MDVDVFSIDNTSIFLWLLLLNILISQLLYNVMGIKYEAFGARHRIEGMYK